MTNHTESDEHWMQKALALAEQGRGKVAPNPMVGAIIVRDGQSVGAGHHPEYGEPHAEKIAIEDAGSDCQGATLYVTLEPCSFTGKTPPCTEAIIDAGIQRVVAAMMDPHPEVRGAGFDRLREEGIDVVENVCQEEAAYLNRKFVTYHTENRPFIIAKWAMSLDGKIATRTGHSQWITSRESRRRARTLRTDAGAVMVGIGTVIEDNPTLLGPDHQDEHPVRIIADSRLRITPDYEIVQTAEKTRTIIATTNQARQSKIRQLEDAGVEVVVVEEKDQQVDFDALCRKLASLDIQAVLVEGGGELLASAFSEGVVGDVNVFVSPKIIGGSDAVTPVEGQGIQRIPDAPELSDVRIEQFDQDVLIEASFREPSDYEVRGT